MPQPANLSSNTSLSSLASNKWYALGLLMLIGLFNYIDRLSMSILQLPIKSELGLSDSQIGILTGLAFSLVYTTVSIPISRLADRYSRKWIIAGTLAIWSLMTAACGAASAFWMLVVFRMGVAVGEAGCVPASHSLIADFFGVRERARAIATYGLIFPLGTLLGFAASGWLATAFGWRQTFFILGILGLLFAPVIVLTLREPVRGATDEVERDGGGESLAQGLRILFSKKSFTLLILGGSSLAYPLNVALVWNPPFYDRIFGIPLADLSLYLALLSGGAGAVGLYLSGIIADKLSQFDLRWYLWVPAGAGALLVPSMFGQYWLASSAVTSFAFGIGAAMMMNAFLAPMTAIAQRLAGPHLRALASAIILFCAGLIGTVLGPLITGLLSDFFLGQTADSGEALRYAVLTSTAVALIGVLMLCGGAHYLRQDLAVMESKGSGVDDS